MDQLTNLAGFDFITSPLVWGAIIFFFIIKKGVYFVPQNRGFVVYTLGKYSQTLSAGINFIIPFVQAVVADRNLKEQSLDIMSQSAITKDNITLNIDGILFMKVVDAAAATNNITDYKLAVTQLAMTTMRNAIGSLELDECFQNRDAINAQILSAMMEATQPWGVMVTRYEIRDITPPQTIREDMEKQMTAEREKRSVILTAEGVKTAAITEAEGKAEAIALVADADAKALTVVGQAAATEEGGKAVMLTLAQDAIGAHKAIADVSTVVLTDGKTSDNISNTVAQAIAVSDALKTS